MQEYYIKLAKDLQELKKIRHDIRNELAALKMLIDSKQYEKASVYLTELSAFFEKANTGTSYSDNIYIDAIMQDLAFKCQNKNILLDAALPIGSLLSLSDTNTVKLFSNIADNAYEAALTSSKPQIKIFVSNRQKWLIITAENTFDGSFCRDENGFIDTKKPDKEHHGFGLKIIQETAALAGGTVKTETNGNTFILTIVFPKN